MFICSAVSADTYTVLNADDSGDDSLRDAVSKANNNPGADTIEFDGSLDNQTITLVSQIDITDTTANGGLTIDAATLNNGITLSGDNASRILGVTEVQTLTLRHLSITAGSTGTGSSSNSDCFLGDSRGGAVCALGDLILFSTTISNSTAKAFGGGFYTKGNATLNNTTISGNHTQGVAGDGGGFYAGGAEIVLNDSIVSDNYTTEFSGDGGGFFAGVDNAINTGKTWLNNSIVSGNYTLGDGGSGGGFHARGETVINNSTISGNYTEGTFVEGGGFYIFGSVTLNNSTVSGNRTTGSATGFKALGSAALNNSTITQNQRVDGSGNGVLFATGGSSTITLNSTILADNGDNNFHAFLYPTSTVTIHSNHSLFGDNASEITNNEGDNIFSNQPGLDVLADNGCATMAGAPGSEACVQTHALLETSPALNKGANNGFTGDQRMSPRVIDSQADIGAYEQPHRLGDCNASGEIDILDVICTINQVLTPDPSSFGECDGTAGINIQDVICVINQVLEN